MIQATSISPFVFVHNDALLNYVVICIYFFPQDISVVQSAGWTMLGK